MGEFRPAFPQFKDNGRGYLADFIGKEKAVVVLFFSTSSINDGNDQEMVSIIERLFAKYGDRVKFFWLNPSEEKDVCKKLSINHYPTISLFYLGQELCKFVCPSSEQGIFYKIEALLSPVHHPDLAYLKQAVPA